MFDAEGWNGTAPVLYQGPLVGEAYLLDSDLNIVAKDPLRAALELRVAELLGPGDEEAVAGMDGTQAKKIPPASLVIEESDAGPIRVSIREHGFRPVDEAGNWFPFQTQLSTDVATGVHEEPDYTGGKQWYGSLNLGVAPAKHFCFSLDLQEDNTFLLYFDVNANGD